MPSCPYCLEEIRAGARKCPHCQTSLEAQPERDQSTVYILDKGLVRFGKFAVGVLGVFILVGIYLFGYDMKEASKKTSEAEIQVQKALLDIERQRGDLNSKIAAAEQRIARIEAIEREVASHRDDARQSVAEAKQLILDIRSQSEEAVRLVADIRVRSLSSSETQVALAIREEKGIDENRGKLWKNGSTIKFRFLDGAEQEKADVRSAIREWTKHVNLVFSEVSTGDADVRISFKQEGSWSFTGTDALGIPQTQPTLNYGTLKVISDRNTRSQITLHEFGHTLGLVHEFQNPDAGNIFDREAVVAFFSKHPNYWDKQTVEMNVLGKVKYPGRRDYDAKSVMNYEFPRNLFMKGKETQPGSSLSDSDKAYASSLYPRQ